MKTVSPLLRRSLVVLAFGLGVLSFSACGGAEAESSSGSGSSPSSSGGSEADDTGRVRLQQCLRENGVDVPDNPGQGGGGGANIDREKLQEAIEGPCKEFQTEGFGNLSEEDRQEMQDRFQKFAQCMRDEGVEIPDIGAGGGGGPPAGGEQIDQDDPDVQAAMEKCQDQLPQGGPGGPPGGGGQQ